MNCIQCATVYLWAVTSFQSPQNTISKIQLQYFSSWTSSFVMFLGVDQSDIMLQLITTKAVKAVLLLPFQV